MATSNRRERERDQTRGKIMDAARRLFAAEGFEAVSMRQIAEDIGYSATAIYVHFKDKRDLFTAICAEDFQGLAEFMRGIAQVSDPAQRMRELGLAYMKFGTQHPSHYRLMFMTRFPGDKADMSPMDHRGDPDRDAWAVCRQAAQALADANLLRPEIADPELAAQTFWAGVHGVVSLQIVKGDDPWVQWTALEARSKAMADALVRGICIDRQPAPRAKARARSTPGPRAAGSAIANRAALKTKRGAQ